MYSDDIRMSEKRDHKWLTQNYRIGKDIGREAVNNWEQMWKKLVKNYPNILLVVSGHVLNEGIGKLVSEGTHGNKVYKMLANYQHGVEGSGNGGNGFLRMIFINTKDSTISVKTYSPFLNKYKTETEQQFTFREVVF